MKEEPKFEFNKPDLLAEFKGYRWKVIPNGNRVKRKKK